MAGKRKLSAKQIKHFGTARQKAALKASRKRKRTASVKRHRPAAKRANPTRRRAVARSNKRVHRPRKRAVARKRTVKRRRSNPGEIVSFVLGNPAKRRKKAMAHSKRRRKAGARRNPAGRRRRAVMTRKRGSHRRRSNPGALGSTGSWVVGGVGILGGVVVTRSLPQLILGSGNTGPLGYAANAATAVLGGFLLNSMGAGRKFAIPFVGGGFAALIARLFSDFTPYGKALSLSGWGDYQFSNIVGTVPQRVISMNTAQVEWGGPPGADRSMSRGGTDMGVRGGNC